jgi:hypothetical protein
MVVKRETNERAAIRNESGKKHNPFVFRAISTIGAVNGRKYGAFRATLPEANIHAASRACRKCILRTIAYKSQTHVNLSVD